MEENINLNSINKIKNNSINGKNYINNIFSVQNYTDKEKKIKEIGKEFENFFIKYLVDNMYKSVEVFSEDVGFERVIWQDFLNTELASKISEKYDLGISEAIYRQITLKYLDDNTVNNENLENDNKDDETLNIEDY